MQENNTLGSFTEKNYCYKDISLKNLSKKMIYNVYG